MAEEKRRSRRDVPHLNWRYILFKWNDSDEEMNRARRLATEIGVDRLSWEITDHPENAFSRRFVPGTPDFEAIKHEIWDMTRPRQRHSRAPRRRRRSKCGSASSRRARSRRARRRS